MIGLDAPAARGYSPATVYDTANHDLYFDQDGTGTTHAAVKLDHFSNNLAVLQITDFLIVA